MENTKTGTSLAVVLLNWNHSIETLDALSRLRLWSSLNPVIIVVDNASSKDEIDPLREKAHGTILILNSNNRGFAGGNNDGIQKALEEECGYILLLNADAEVTEECIKYLLSILENYPDIGIIGPLLQEREKIFAGGRDIGLYSNTRIPFSRSRSNEQITTVDYVPGTVFLVKSEVFNKIGLLSEEFFFSGEIADFCCRSRDEGFRCTIYNKCTAVHHIEQGKWRDLIYPYYSLRNRFLYVRRRSKNMWLPLFIRWWTSGMFHGSIAYVRGNRPLACALYLALKDGIRGIYGNQHERIKAACHHSNSELEWDALA